jgi:hypothetical protein
MNSVLQFAQAYWPVLSVGGIGAAILAYVNRDLVIGNKATELPKVLAGVFHGEVVEPSDDETDKLRDALKTLTCHVALSIDDPAEQASALNACRTLKKHIPAPVLPTRPPQAIENQEAVIAAVQAYNTTADKITAVG